MQPDRGSVVKSVALCAGLLASSLTVSGAVLAQPVPPPVYPGAAYSGPAYPGPVYRAAPYPGPVHPGYGPGLPPYEIVAVVRSTGLEPLTRPVRNGAVYALRALDPVG